MAGAKAAKRPLATGSRAKRARRRSAHVMKPEYLVEIERIDKGSEEGRRTMCEAFERIRDRGKAEGEARGERKNMLATAKRLLANGKLVLKEIAQCTGLSLAQVKKLQASMA